jgi:hypothetical protein
MSVRDVQQRKIRACLPLRLAQIPIRTAIVPKLPPPDKVEPARDL